MKLEILIEETQLVSSWIHDSRVRGMVQNGDINLDIFREPTDGTGGFKSRHNHQGSKGR